MTTALPPDLTERVERSVRAKHTSSLESLGARHMREWYTYRLNAEQLKELAAES